LSFYFGKGMLYKKGEIIMKKEIGLLVTVLAIGALAGCDTKNNTDKSESTHSSTHTSTTISSESSRRGSEAPSSSAAQTSSKTVTQAGTLDQLSAAFPQDRLPSEVPVTEQKTLNAATDEGADQLSILYYQLNDQRELNDPSLNNETPIASYKNAAYENRGLVRRSYAARSRNWSNHH